MPSTHSAEVARLLLDAGWQPGRQVSTELWEADVVRPFPAALAVLREFGGLQIGTKGPGLDFARSDVDLTYCKPTRPEWVGYPDLERSVGQRLCTLGVVHGGNAELLIDESGRIYHLAEDLNLVASSFSEALEALLLGKRPRTP